MASLNGFFFAPIAVAPKRNVRAAATASKSSTSVAAEEKGLFDFILGGLAKQDQIYETDPVLKKVEKKSGGTGSRSSAVVAQPEKKDGGGFDFGGFFSNK